MLLLSRGDVEQVLSLWVTPALPEVKAEAVSCDRGGENRAARCLLWQSPSPGAPELGHRVHTARLVHWEEAIP